jgi:hypothetical protein
MQMVELKGKVLSSDCNTAKKLNKKTSAKAFMKRGIGIWNLCLASSQGGICEPYLSQMGKGVPLQ